jgi:hypothetical protein
MPCIFSFEWDILHLFDAFYAISLVYIFASFVD